MSLPTTCRVCKKPTSTICSRCREVYYCGIEHQKTDWKTHKLICNIQGKGVDSKQEKQQEKQEEKEERLDDFGMIIDLINSESKAEILERIYGICPACKSNRHDFVYCQNRNCDYRDISNIKTSGNRNLDDFMRETLLDPTKPIRFRSYLRWIPYKRLANIQQIEKSDYAIVYKAIWLDCYTLAGYISRGRLEYTVALKRLRNSQNMSEYILNDIKTYRRYSCSNAGRSYLELHGITQDPETKEYLIVMSYANHGDLKNHLRYKIDMVPWGNKVDYLSDLAMQLNEIHGTRTVHCNLHSGNICVSSISFGICDTERHVYIIGFRHSCPENTPISDVYGILPYVAPEILRKQPYTTAADVYSFGVIMYELASGKPPYPDRPHNAELALDIIQGLRPKFIEGTPQCYVNLAERCLDVDPHKRPSAKELTEITSEWCHYYGCDSFIVFNSEIYQQFDKATKLLSNTTKNPIMELHPEAIYTSRALNDIIEAVN